MDSIRVKTKQLQSKMYLTQTQTCRLKDSDPLTHKIGRLCSERMLISYQRSPRMVSIIIKGTLFLYHLLAWKSCMLSRTRCQCLKWKLTRRIHNLFEFVFDLGWPIMTGPRRDYGISHRTSTPRYEMVSLAMLYN